MADEKVPSAKALAKSWVHSHEEDSGDVMVFRPAGYPFPPARGRDTLDLASGGKGVTSRPGPDDRSVTAATEWQVDGDELIVGAGGGERRYRVERVDDGALHLRRLH